MPDPVDPGSLAGDALTQWYTRSPDEIEQARQNAYAQRYNDFFCGSMRANPDSGFAKPLLPGAADIDPGFSRNIDLSNGHPDPGFTWTQIGRNRWRSTPTQIGNDTPGPAPQSAILDGGLWNGDAGATAGEALVGSGGPSNAMGQTSPPPGASPMAQNGNLMLASTRSSGPVRGGPANDSSTNISPPAPSRVQQPSRPDPQRTDVFQPGPDGKLQPIPGWHTTGPFDFGTWSHNIDWPGVANDLGTIASGAFDGLAAAGWAGDMVAAAGSKVAPAIETGIKEAIQKHHGLPKFMGGRVDQELADVYKSLHVKFHRNLSDALGEAGFPRVGGKGGGTLDWGTHFNKNPGSYEKAIGVLQRVTRDFDEAHGTSISPYLEKELRSGLSRPPPPRN